MNLTITMTADEIKRFDQPVHYGMKLLEKLRKRGVPAIGSIALIGVETGAITMSTAPNGDRLYVYTAPDDDEEL